MGFELSFGGIPFLKPDPETLAWIEERISLADLRETIPYLDASSLSKNLRGIAMPRWPEKPKLRIGDFFYPTGATRWAEFHGLATTSDVRKMIALAVNTTSTALRGATFKMKTDVSGPTAQQSDFLGGISTKLHMLPPRDLTAWGIAEGPLAANKREGLHLVSLVDERWFLQYQTGVALHPTSGQTWDAILGTLAGALNGITLNYESAAAVYGGPSPDSAFWSNYESIAVLIDAAAWNTGRVVIRKLDGTLFLQTSTAAGNATLAQRDPTKNARLAGYNNLQWPGVANAIMPGKVTVTYPKYKTGTGFLDGTRPSDAWIQDSYGEVYAVTKTLADLGAPYNAFQGTVGVKVIRDTARAYYDEDDALTNEDELEDLAFQLAKDYYNWQIIGIDEVYPGIRQWTPEGIHDVLFRLNDEIALTRVQRRPWNLHVEEMQHGFEVPDGIEEDEDDPGQNATVKVFAGPDELGYYQGLTQHFIVGENFWFDGGLCHIVDDNGRPLTTQRYEGTYKGKHPDDDLPVFVTDAGGLTSLEDVVTDATCTEEGGLQVTIKRLDLRSGHAVTFEP